MIYTRILVGAAALACGSAFAGADALAAAADYRFELVGKPHLVAAKVQGEPETVRGTLNADLVK